MRFTAAERPGGAASPPSGSGSRWSATCSAGSACCGHCQLGPVLVCRDGPVFPYVAGRPLLDPEGAVMAEPLPKLAVWKFASCDGCQLTLLDCEDELLAVAGRGRDRQLHRGVAARWSTGPYDVSLVEGSVTTAHDAERIQEVRAVVAVPGHDRRLRHRRRHPGAAQLRRRRRVRLGRLRPPRVHRHPGDLDPDLRPRRRWTSSCAAARSTAASCSRCSPRCCAGRKPDIPDHSVCQRVQAARQRLRDGRPRHAVPRPGHPGRLRRALPGVDRGCYGCFGPMETPNTASLSAGGCTPRGWTTGTVMRRLPHVQRHRAGLRRRRAGPGAGRRDACDPPGTRSHRRRGSPGSRARAAMHVVVPRRRGRPTSRLRHLRAAPLLRGASCAAARYTEPPDITARICGICPVAYQMSACQAIEDACGVVDRPRRCAACAGCSTAGSGSRATPCTSTCCTPPTSSAARSALELAKDHRELVETGLGSRRPATSSWRWSAAGPSIPSTCGSAASTGLPHRARAAAASAERLRWRARRRARDRRAGSPTFDFPDLEHRPRASWRSATRTSTRSTEGAVVSDRRPGHRRWPSSPSTSSRSTCRTRPRCTRGWRRRAATWPGRWPATASTTTSLPELAREAAAAAGLGTVCRNPFRSIHGAGRRDGVRLRRGAADHRGLRAADRRPCRVEPRAGVGPRSHRGAARPPVPPLPDRRRRA